MLTEKQLKLFEVLAKIPFNEFTRKSIKKESGEKSNNALALAINLLKRENVIIEKKVGKSGLLTLNLDNDLTSYYIALCNNRRISPQIKESLELLKMEVNSETHFFSLVIFGSYASAEQKKSSDIDIAVFIENEKRRKQIESLANSAKSRSVLEMDINVIPKEEMIEMLTNKEENLGKQIARKHIAAYNHRIFYELVKEARDHGFRA